MSCDYIYSSAVDIADVTPKPVWPSMPDVTWLRKGLDVSVICIVHSHVAYFCHSMTCYNFLQLLDRLMCTGKYMCTHN